MASPGGKGDAQVKVKSEQSKPGAKSGKSGPDKAEKLKNYYKKKHNKSEQDGFSTTPADDQSYRISATHDSNGGHSSKKKGQSKEQNDISSIPDSYSQLKNSGKRDLSSEFQNCHISDRVDQDRQRQASPRCENRGPNSTGHRGQNDRGRGPNNRGGGGNSGGESRRQPNRVYHGKSGEHRVNSPRQHTDTYTPKQHNTPRGNTPRKKGHVNQDRQKLFEEYWKKEDVQAELKRGQLIEGPVRINPGNYEEAYVAHPDGQSDIYIPGLEKRNRALNGDWVAVFVEQRDKWRVNISKMEESAGVLQEIVKTCCTGGGGTGEADGAAALVRADAADVVVEEEYEETSDGEVSTPQAVSVKGASTGEDTATKDASDSTPTTKITKSENSEPHKNTPKLNLKEGGANGAKTPDGRTPQKGQSTPKTPQKRKTYTSLEDIGTENSGSSKLEAIFSPTKVADKKQALQDAIPNDYLQRTGKVVYITEMKHSRASTGHLRLSSRPKFALFSPTDHRVPRINIPLAECPEDFQQRPEDHVKTLYVARITDWKEDQRMPLGALSRSLGEAGEIEPETEGILLSYDVDCGEFPQACLDCLPVVSAANPWRIPASEFTYRRDFRKECVFTIDPPTARDLDDALHVNSLGNDEYEVGVHIADVSYFVDHATALDKVAASRATSVYLVQKVIPMLPRLLCEQLCSLNPDEDRLTFSVVWRMTGGGDILDEWFGRSVIRSCAKMGYNHAQGFLDEPNREWRETELPPISGGFGSDLIKQKVLILNKIAQALRRKRYAGGALSLNQVKMQFTLDRETGMPCGYSVYQQKDSNRLIEEFMLLANMAVARKIYTSFPEAAVLRRHPPPQQKMVDELQELLNNLGMDLDLSSAKAIQESLLQYTGGNPEMEAQSQILTALCSKAMQLAKYFCTGMYDDDALYRHYALSVPLYTHFTSPIRRYPDVMVHRALAAALGYTELPAETKEEIQKQCTHCNDKKIAAKSVQDLSNQLFFSAFVKECGPLEERGMVMGLSEKSFDVLLLNLGVVKRVFVEKLAVESSQFRQVQKKPELYLTWQADDNHPRQQRQTLSIFSPVNCVLTADATDPLRYHCLLKHPEEPLVCTQLPDRRPEDTNVSAIMVNYEDV